MANHWKMAGLVAGGIAVGYALIQDRERVAGAVANAQDTLTNNGLILLQKLSEMADAFLAKVHETFVAAAPPANLEAAVRHGLTGQSDNAVTTPVRQGRPKAPRTRLRENDTNMDYEKADDPAYQPDVSHHRRRMRHSGPEQSATPSQHCSSRAAGAAARRDWQASLLQDSGEDDSKVIKQQSNEAGAATQPTAVAMQPTGDEWEMMDATAVPPLPREKRNATQPTSKIAKGDTHAKVAINKLASAQGATIAQRAQAEPASLLGARLSATWVNETFACEVMMIRKGKGDKFEALVKYDNDGIEQWEVIGEPPYKHTLIAEPVDAWLSTGSALIDAHTLRCIDSRKFEGVVMAWLPKRDGHESLYKIYHIADGDFEELNYKEVTAAISLFIESTNGAITKE